MERLQRDVQQVFDPSPAIRGFGRGGFPALNIGGTPSSVEIYAFAPGLDPKAIELNIDRGVLTLAGERPSALPDKPDDKTTLHANERFAGRFRRVVSLPDDIDPANAWNPTEVHVRVYPAKERFSAAIAQPSASIMHSRAVA